MFRPMLRVVLMLISALPFTAVSASQDHANDQTRRLIRQIMMQQRIPGLQVAVVKDGRSCCPRPTAWPTSRTACLLRATPASRSTRPPRRSPAWRRAAGAGGAMDLDAPASRYLDDLPPAWRDVRVHQLLAHTSGLPDILDANGLLGAGSEAQAWAAVTAQPVEAEPGSASPTTRPTTFFWHGSSRSNPACPTNVSSPPASSAARAWPAPPSATATT